MSSWKVAGEKAALDEAHISPLDGHNVTLLDHVFPRDYVNPKKPDDFVYDLVAVGAGAAGLVSAKQTARRGGKSCLIEEHLAGGDCLNVGCVPSKALLRCARSMAERRRVDLGAAGDATPVDFGKVMERMRELRAKIGDVDSVETTKKAGADAFVGRGVFTGRNELEVKGQKIRFKKAVVCTGGRATVPPIPGLRESSYMTHVQLFNLTELPKRFCVVGGGPIGLEMAQSFARFGSEVTLLEAMPRILGPEDPEASAILQRSLESDGIRILVDAQIKNVEDLNGGKQIKITCTPGGGEKVEIVCDKLLVAAGRAANVENLGLEAAGVEYKLGMGIKVNDDLSTTNPDIFAAGDCTDQMAFRFTHTAGCMASVVVSNALFEGKSPPVLAPSGKVSEIVVPRCTFTEPEVASCGIANLQQAERAGMEVDTYTSDLEHNDRCILEGDHHGGFVKILCQKGTDKIVGGVIVAERAGEMLAEITLAAQRGLPISALGRTVHPYPTAGEGVQQAALNYIRKSWERLEPGAVASGVGAPLKNNGGSTQQKTLMEGHSKAAMPGKDLSIAGLTGCLAKSEGRDKLGRVFQYGSRMIVGLVELSGAPKGSPLMELKERAADVQKTLGGARRTHRWGKEIPVIQSLPGTLKLLQTSPLDFALEMFQKLNQLGYLLFDHLAWLKQQKLFVAGKSAADTVKTAMTFFLCCNAAATVIQLKKYSNEKDEGKKSTALTAAFKHFLVAIQCAHNSTIYETNNAFVGACGIISSYIDLKAQWPNQK